MISKARKDDSDSQEALENLCRDYWRPVYAFVRSAGHSSTDAEDLTQDFFAHFLERRGFSQAAEHRGRFRSFLLRCVKNHLIDQNRARNAAKRGGNLPIHAIDGAEWEREWGDEVSLSSGQPEAVFDRHWATSLVANVLEEIHRDYVNLGKESLFLALSPAIHGSPDAGFYDAASEELGSTVNAVRLATSRLRSRYRKALFNEVAELIENPTDEEVKAEITYLYRALASG